MGGLTQPKGGKNLTSTQTKTMPGYVTDAQQGLLSAAQNITGDFLQKPAYANAGLNADQLGAFDLTRSLAQGAFTNPRASVPAATGYAPRIAGNAATYEAAGTNGAAQVTGAGIRDAMSPYLQSVLDPTLANMRRQSDMNAAQIGAQSAASNSYGGSREALRQAQNTRALGEQTAQIVPQLYQGAFDKAAQIAGQNASAVNADRQFNAQAQNQAGQFNANGANTLAQFNAGVINDAARFGVTNGMQGAQLQDALDTAQQQRQLQAIQALLGIGGQQQQFAQGVIDDPIKKLQVLAGIVPKETDSTTTGVQPNTANSPLMNILGLGGSLLGMGTGGGGTVFGNLIGAKKG